MFTYRQMKTFSRLLRYYQLRLINGHGWQVVWFHSHQVQRQQDWVQSVLLWFFSFLFFFSFSLVNSGFLSNHSPGRTFPIITDKEKTDFLSTDIFLSFQCKPDPYEIRLKNWRNSVPCAANLEQVMRDDVYHFVKYQIAGGSNGGKVWRCCHVPNTGSYFYLWLDKLMFCPQWPSLSNNEKKQNKKCLPFHPKACCNLDGCHAFWKVVDVYCQIVSLTFLDTIFNSATKCFYKLNQTKYVMNPWEFWPIFFL